MTLAAVSIEFPYSIQATSHSTTLRNQKREVILRLARRKLIRGGGLVFFWSTATNPILNPPPEPRVDFMRPVFLDSTFGNGI